MVNDKSGKIQMTIYIDPQLHKTFKVVCAQTGTTMSEEVEKLIMKHIYGLSIDAKKEEE